MSNYWLLAKIIAAYVGAVIGAGFASGQEIMQFFVLHGKGGLLGALLVTALFAYLGGLVMYLSIKKRFSSFQGIMTYLLGPRLGKWMDGLSLIMLLGGLSVMMAGSAAIFIEYFGLPGIAGGLALAALTSVVLLGGLEGVLMASVILVPLKFLAVSLISLGALWCTEYQPGFLPAATTGAGVGRHWLVAAILYVSYNMVVPVAVLSSLGRIAPLKLGVLGGALGGLMLGIAVSLVTLAGLAHMPEASHCQIPLLYLAGQLGEAVRLSMGFLIWIAILTTAIADAHGLASRLAPDNDARYRYYGIGACLMALPLAGLSFSNMVAVVYPLFGLAGLVLLLALLMVPAYRFLQGR